MRLLNELRSLFQRKAATGAGRASSLSRPASARNSRSLAGTQLPHDAELELYRQMRRSFPVLDIGLTRLVQLIGCPTVGAPGAIQAELQQWADNLLVLPGQASLTTFLARYADDMLLYGRSAAELVLDRPRRDIAALKALDPRYLTLEYAPDGINLACYWHPPGSFGKALLPPALTITSLHAPQDSPHGSSLLRSLPFVAEATGIIENATAQAWQRFGNPSFHVNWQPADGFSDPDGDIGAAVAGELEDCFSAMMTARASGQVKDFFTAGTIAVEEIGSPAHLAAIREPIRVFLEQMVSVLGLPPWMLGLHWSSTERLSVQQADMLVATISAYRSALQPALDYLLQLKLKMRAGATNGPVKWVWPAVNLRDANEQARAAAWREQARQRRIENARRMWELGFWDQHRAALECDPELLHVAAVYATPPAPRAPSQARLSPGPDQ